MHSAVRSLGVNVSNPTNGKVLLLVAGSQCKPLHLWWSSIFSSVFVSVPVSSFLCFPVAQVLERRMASQPWLQSPSQSKGCVLWYRNEFLTKLAELKKTVPFLKEINNLSCAWQEHVLSITCHVSLQTLCPLCCMDPVGKHCYCQIECMHCFG